MPSAEPRRGNILIVDDSSDNLRVLSASLSREGYEVRCVRRGSMALTGVRISPPDLILLDIRMPEMDGYEVCRRLKADATTCAIPIIFLSALDEVLDKVKAFDVGGADYITKPFQLQEVVARIEHQLTIRRLQKQLLEQNALLQQEIREHEQTEASLRDEIHSRAMAEAALKNAKDAAEAANYAKSEFLSKMSHELRTPLNAILGFAQVMQKEEDLSVTQHDFLAIIERNGEHLLDLINTILEMTKIEAGQVSLNINISDMHRLLDTLHTALASQARSKGLQLQFERSPTVPLYARLDERKLRSVLMNLLGNAIQFTDRGSITLRVWAERGLVPKATESSDAMTNLIPYTLLFEVEDTGLGIAPDDLGKLFDVFSQTEAGRNSGQGIGLGLTISRHFVSLMGGEITIQSALNQGTRVRFTIQVQSSESIDLLMPSPDSLVQAIAPAAPLSAAAIESAAVTISQLRTVMPDEWIVQLHQAAVKGLDHHILRLLNDIPTNQELILHWLTAWAENYQFDKIIELTQPVVQ